MKPGNLQEVLDLSELLRRTKGAARMHETIISGPTSVLDQYGCGK
jgi:hypothetical protein